MDAPLLPDNVVSPVVAHDQVSRHRASFSLPSHPYPFSPSSASSNLAAAANPSGGSAGNAHATPQQHTAAGAYAAMASGGLPPPPGTSQTQSNSSSLAQNQGQGQRTSSGSVYGRGSISTPTAAAGAAGGHYTPRSSISSPSPAYPQNYGNSNNASIYNGTGAFATATPYFSQAQALASPAAALAGGAGGSVGAVTGGGHALASLPNVRVGGYLMKQGHTFKVWRRRFFLFNQDRLEYRTSPSAAQLQGMIPLRRFRLETYPNLPESKALDIVTPGTLIHD